MSQTVDVNLAYFALQIYKYKFSWWAPKTDGFWNTVRNGRSVSSKVVDFGTNRKRVCNFLLVICSNIGPILPRFRDISSFLLTIATPPGHPYSTRILVVFPLNYIVDVGDPTAKTLR